MKPQTYFDTAGTLVSKHEVGVIKVECKGNDSMADNYWWQIHDFAPSYNLAAPANGAVPLKSWPLGPGGQDYKEFKQGELRLQNGLYVCVSTTEATKTLGTSNNKFSMLQAELDADDPLAGVTAVEGSAANLEVWAEGDGPMKLVLIRATNLESDIRYLQLFAHDTPADGSRALAQWELAATGDSDGLDSRELRFGLGRSVDDISGGAVRQGCTLMLSDTAGTLTVATGSGMECYAEKL